jgi:hypothetical protein
VYKQKQGGPARGSTTGPNPMQKSHERKGF